jgi:DNA-binding CsgD family transcriptional regulator
MPPTDEPVSILTRREREVATLVAKILKKLRLRSRTQIASWFGEPQFAATFRPD